MIGTSARCWILNRRSEQDRQVQLPWSAGIAIGYTGVAAGQAGIATGCAGVATRSAVHHKYQSARVLHQSRLHQDRKYRFSNEKLENRPGGITKIFVENCKAQMSLQSSYYKRKQILFLSVRLPAIVDFYGSIVFCQEVSSEKFGPWLKNIHDDIS